MGLVLMQVELISLAKLLKEENQVEASSPGRTERNLKKFDVFIRNLQMGLNSMLIQNLPQINNMFSLGRWGNMFGQENLRLICLEQPCSMEELGPICLGQPYFHVQRGQIMLAEENWNPFAHDPIFSQRIWAHFPILVALSSHLSPRTLLIYLGQLFSLKLGPILHPIAMGSSCFRQPCYSEEIGSTFLGGPLPFSFLFFLMKVIQEERLS